MTVGDVVGAAVLAHPTRRQPLQHQFARHVEVEDDVDGQLGGDQVDGKMVLEDLDPVLLSYRGEQRPLDFPPGHIFGVEDPALGMPAFPAEVQFPFSM